LRGLGGHGAAPGSGTPSIATLGCDRNKKAPPVAGLEGQSGSVISPWAR
jgi:hypothetical protein